MKFDLVVAGGEVLDHHVRTRMRAFVNLSAIGITGAARGGEPSHFPNDMVNFPKYVNVTPNSAADRTLRQ